MSFTEDELQAFNSILEQRLAAHRQEVERAFDQRLLSFYQNVERRFATIQQEMLEFLGKRLTSNTDLPGQGFAEKLQEQREQIERFFSQETAQKSRQVEITVDQMMAAQLLGIEQLLNQHLTRRQLSGVSSELGSQIETIEVQTELAWEDLVSVMGKALDERLEALNDSLQLSVKNLEQYLATRLHALRDDLARVQPNRAAYASSPISNGSNMQEAMVGIEHLERIMESMQVAMTANQALLSNRLYHHQQLPLERAHPNPGGQTRVAPADGLGQLLTQASEPLANGRVQAASAMPGESDEPTGH